MTSAARHTLRSSLLVLAATLTSARLDGQAEHRAILRGKLEAELKTIAESFDGVFGARVVDLTDSSSVGVNDDLVFPTASAIKVAVLLELFRQAEGRPGLLRVRRAVPAASQVGGTGISQNFGDGTSLLSLEDLAVLMIVLSDNTATNILIDELGMDAVNRTLTEFGLRHTKLQRKMIRPEASLRGEENLSTPAESAALMVGLARCNLPVSKASCDRLRAILEIPKENPVRDPVPRGVRIAFKPGNIEGVAAVWALVELPDRPYVLTVMTNYGGDGAAAIRRASEVAYRHFSKLSRATPYGTRVPLDLIRRLP